MTSRFALPAVSVALACALALCGCDNGKPRHLPPDPFAAPPPPAGPVAPPTEGMSKGLAKRAEQPGWFIDHIGGATDPLNHPPATTVAAAPILIDGFGFDPVAKLPAKGVDVVVDGKAYGTVYGHARPDVGDYFKTPALSASGFRVTLPAGAVIAGAHSLKVRVVAADGKGYFESKSVPFEVE